MGRRVVSGRRTLAFAAAKQQHGSSNMPLFAVAGLAAAAAVAVQSNRDEVRFVRLVVGDR
jgi:hypothetical protein